LEPLIFSKNHGETPTIRGIPPKFGVPKYCKEFAALAEFLSLCPNNNPTGAPKKILTDLTFAMIISYILVHLVKL